MSNFFAGACAQIKILRLLDGKAPYHFPHFRLFIYLFFRFIFFFSLLLFAAVFDLLPGFFRVEEFPRKRKRDKNYLP